MHLLSQHYIIVTTDDYTSYNATLPIPPRQIRAFTAVKGLPPPSYFGKIPSIRHHRFVKLIDNTCFAPTYTTREPVQPSLPWHKPVSSILPPFSQQLNTQFLTTHAYQFLSPQRAKFVKLSLQNGFPSFNVMPPIDFYNTPNKVQPFTPMGDVVTKYLKTFQDKGHLLSYSSPVLPGTHTFAIDIVAKVKFDNNGIQSTKYRPVFDGSQPGRKEFTLKKELQYTNQSIYELMAFALSHNVIFGSLLDYEAFFTVLNRNYNDVASNCVYWDMGDGFKFHYLLSHGFGEAHTPFCADTLGALLQTIQQHEINTTCDYQHFLIRRTDDTLVTHSTTRSQLSLLHNATPQSPYMDAQQAIHTIHTVCTNAAVPIQNKKTKIAETTSLFDGFIFNWSLHGGSIGVPQDKKKKLLLTIAQVRHKFRTNRTDPNHKFFTKLSSTKIIESLVGQLEWASQVFYYLRSRIPAIRATNFHSAWEKPQLSSQAKESLEIFHNVCDFPGHTYVPFSNYFEQSPSFTIYTDASGKDGIGGYSTTPGSRYFFTESIPTEWNLHLTTSLTNLSSTWLELFALFIVLTIHGTTYANASIQWFTDSNACTKAMRNCASNQTQLNLLLIPIFHLLTKHSICITTTWIPRTSNTGADDLSKFHIQEFCDTHDFDIIEQVFVPHACFQKGRMILSGSTTMPYNTPTSQIPAPTRS
jgi:hypothetical protein